MSGELRAFHIYDLGGGLNNYDANEDVADNQGTTSFNTVYEGGSALRQRRTLKRNEVYDFAAGIDGLFIRENSDDTVSNFMAKSGTDLYDGGPSGTKLRDFLIAGERMRAVPWEGLYGRVYLALGGSSDAQRYGYTASPSTSNRYMFNIGLDAPDTDDGAGMWATDGDAGTTQDGFVNVGWTLTLGPAGSWGETEVTRRGGTAHDHTGYSAKKYKTNRIPQLIGAATITHAYYSIKVYATEGGYATSAEALNAPMFYTGQEVLETDVTDWDTNDTNNGAYIVQWEDSDLDFTTPAPTTDTTGTIGSRLLTQLYRHNSRLWVVGATNPDRVYYSNLEMPDEYPADNWFDAEDFIRGMASFQGDLIIFGNYHIERMRGWSPSDFSATRETLHRDVGCLATDSIAEMTVQGQPMLIFANTQSVWAFDGVRVHDIGYRIRGTFDDIYSTNVSDIRACVFRNHYLMAYLDPNASGSCNNRILAFNGTRGTWHTWDGANVGAWLPYSSGKQDQLRWGECTSTGRIYAAGGDALGYESCDFLHRTKYYAPEGPHTVKQIHKIIIKIERDSLPIGIRLYLDGEAQAYGTGIPSIPPGGEWTSDQWDVWQWGASGSDYAILKHECQASLLCREFAIEFWQDGSSTAKNIAGFSIIYSVEEGII